jgi:hypothetical protein
MEINLWALAAATVAAFVISSLWYAAFGRRLARLSDAYAGCGDEHPMCGQASMRLSTFRAGSRNQAMFGPGF